MGSDAIILRSPNVEMVPGWKPSCLRFRKVFDESSTEIANHSNMSIRAIVQRNSDGS